MPPVLLNISPLPPAFFFHHQLDKMNINQIGAIVKSLDDMFKDRDDVLVITFVYQVFRIIAVRLSYPLFSRLTIAAFPRTTRQFRTPGGESRK